MTPTSPINTDALRYALEALTTSLFNLRSAILEASSVGRGLLFDASTGCAIEGAPAELLLKALTTLDVSVNSTNGSVVRFPGTFEASDRVIAAAVHLNENKQALEQCIKDLERQGVKPRQMRQLYSRFGHGRIHPLQAWRQINILEGAHLASIGFTVAKATEGIEVLALDEALNRLRQANAFDVIEQLEHLGPIGKIYWHTPISRHIRANVVWQNGGERKAVMYHASLPFLVPMGSWPERWIRFNQPRKHAQRRDTKRSMHIYLPFRNGAHLSIA